MNDNLKNIPLDMRELGLGALMHANRHAAYSGNMINDKWAELAVLQAAHAAEILIKARIAEEHPLLLFDTFPSVSDEEISVEQLFDDGKTIEWSKLYTLLWASTGIHIANKNLFTKFGRLRNGLQHFGVRPTNIGPALETLKFIYGVIDPFINKCWDLYAIDYDEDDDPYEHLVPVLISYEIDFLVSPDSLDYIDFWKEELSECSSEYQHKLTNKIEKAKEALL